MFHLLCYSVEVQIPLKLGFRSSPDLAHPNIKKTFYISKGIIPAIEYERL